MGPKMASNSLLIAERPAPGERKRPRNFSSDVFNSSSSLTKDNAEEECLLSVRALDLKGPAESQQSPQEQRLDDSQHQSSHHGDSETLNSDLMEARLSRMPSRKTMAHAIYRASATSFANLLPLRASENDAEKLHCSYCRGKRLNLAGSEQFQDICTCERKHDDVQQEEEEKPVTVIRTIYDKCEAVRATVSKYAGYIVNDQGFQILMVMLILLNSLLIGISTFDFVENSPLAKNAFETLDLAFLIVFTVELVTQFLHHGYNLFKDGWLIFDLIIVVTSWTLESISVLRTLRLRSFRIFRAFRLTTKIRALRRLVLALFEVFPKISAILCLFSLIMYIFGVMCTELFGDLVYDPPLEYDYFGSLDASVFTLFVMVTLDWATVSRIIMQKIPWSAAIFCTFVTFSSFCLYNLVIAVVCDAVKMVQDQDDVLMVERYYNEKVEARERVVNLRQKVDKMTKQQNDLLRMVKMMLEQLDLVDEDSRADYEETLIWLQNGGIDAKTALEFAIKTLGDLDNVSSTRTHVADAWDRELQSRFDVFHGEGAEHSFEIQRIPNLSEHEGCRSKDPPLVVKSIGLGTFEIIGNGSMRFDDVRLDDIVEDDNEADNQGK